MMTGRLCIGCFGIQPRNSGRVETHMGRLIGMGALSSCCAESTASESEDRRGGRGLAGFRLADLAGIRTAGRSTIVASASESPGGGILTGALGLLARAMGMAREGLNLTEVER